MRKMGKMKKIGKMRFKRSLAALMAITLVMGSSITVFAEDGLDPNNTIDTTVEYELFGTQKIDTNKFVDSTDPAYHNDEAAEVAKDSTSVKEMNEQAEIAKDAATDAKDAVDELKQDVADLKLDDKKTDAQTAADTATNDVTAADTAAKDAATTVGALPTDTADKVDDYNAQVATDQVAVDAVKDIDVVKDGSGNIIVGQVDDGQGGTKEVTLEDFVYEQAKVAEAASADAKAKLGEALAIDTNVVTQEVKDKVDEVIAAANVAQAAADTAQDVFDKAQAQLDEAEKTYNLYAMAYGLPLYGETTVTYTDTEKQQALVDAAANGLNIVDQESTKEKLEAEITTIEGTSLDAQKAKVETAATSVGTAETKLTEAKDAAEDAKTLAETAKTLVDEKDVTADGAAEKVNDYYVDPATETLNKTKADIQAKNTEIKNLTNEKTQAQADYDAAQATAQANKVGESTYNTELQNRLAAKLKAEQEYNNCPSWKVFTKAALKDKRNEARNNYNNYETEETKAKVIEAEIEKLPAVVAAKNNIQKAETGIVTKESELTELNKQKVTEEAVLAAAENTKQTYLNEISTAYQNDAKDAFKAAITAELQKNSDQINQVDYDKALNDFVNDTFNSWSLFNKGIVRDDLNDKYDMDTIRRIFNTSMLTQFFVSTDSTEKVMNALQEVYKSEIEQYSEKMATAEANWAAMDTEAAKAAVQTEIDKIDTVTTELAAVETQVTTAKTTLATAQSTYATAEAELKAIQDSIKNCTFSNIELKSLNDRIKAAQKKLNAAKDELKLAQAAAASAENYANWGKQLVADQATMLFAKAVVDANGAVVLDANGKKTAQSWYNNNFDLSDLDVKSRDTKYFLDIDKTKTINVPYTIYKEYVNAMYKNYNYIKDVETNSGKAKGKGIATGDTTNTGGTSSMSIVYWEMDANGGLTGKYFLSTNGMTTGQYFVGYTFKHENDGYHIDGLMYDYVAPAPTTTPSPSPSTNPSTPPATPPTTPGTPPTTPVTPPTTPATPVVTTTIPDAPVALAAAPAPVADAAVLGATRTLDAGTDAAVLGARRGTDQAVLGKRRRPETGDSLIMTIWLMTLGLSAAAATVAATQIVKGKKKSEE